MKRQGEALEALLRLLVEDPHSPTAVRDPVEARAAHIEDSLAGLAVPAVKKARRIADLGSGAGLPGLVLAIELPETEVVLVESVARKARWAARAARELGMGNIEVVPARVEEWTAGAGTCDVVTVRALASLPVLVEYAAPLLREGGTLVCWKAKPGAAEVGAGRAAAVEVGLEESGVLRADPFPDHRPRTLYVYSKVRATPPRFPRRAGMATKRPLGAQSGRT